MNLLPVKISGHSELKWSFSVCFTVLFLNKEDRFTPVFMITVSRQLGMNKVKVEKTQLCVASLKM